MNTLLPTIFQKRPENNHVLVKLGCPAYNSRLEFQVFQIESFNRKREIELTKFISDIMVTQLSHYLAALYILVDTCTIMMWLIGLLNIKTLNGSFLVILSTLDMVIVQLNWDQLFIHSVEILIFIIMIMIIINSLTEGK